MTLIRGRNINQNNESVVTTVEINSTTATTLVLPNDKRIALSISLDSGTDNIQAFIRLFPASDNNDKKGDLLTRRTFGNESLFESMWRMMADNVFTGEVSAIAVGSSFNLHITEY